ncbi:MAG TPA: RNA 2',3'-cyclic phosphodiesterase [Steroidobacteraceae bacterium]|nr:RNA 2',3'-cyclic phosphodiesterase [Steroidobacteraceae bacterium]
MRLFFALWPDEDVRGRLAHVAGGLKLAGDGGRLVSPGSFHLTVAFVGEVPDVKLAVMQQIGRSTRVPKFTISCASTEFWAKSHVVVAAAQEIPEGLLELWQYLHDAIGLPRSPFRAHVTLARKIAQAPVLPAMSAISWRVASFSLIRSDTGGRESAYTVVDTWPLLYES